MPFITITQSGVVRDHETSAAARTYLNENLKEGERYICYEGGIGDDPGVIEAVCDQARDSLRFSRKLVEQLRDFLSGKEGSAAASA